MDVQDETLTKRTKTHVASVTDAEVIARVQSGAVEDFEIIMRRYNQRIYRIARSIVSDEHEAMDVVQETYVKAYYHLHEFKGPAGFPSWLSRIASNEAIARVRKSSRIVYTLDAPGNEHLEMESLIAQPMDDLAASQLRKLLEEAIDTLPVEYRCVYVMRAIQQLSTKETAQSLDVSEDVIKTRYLRAKRSLQKIFDAHLEKAGLTSYEFAGKRCDAIVDGVMKKIQSD